MEQQKATEITKADILTLPDPPELVKHQRMAQIMIENELVPKSKNKSREKLLNELELKLYHCELLNIPVTYANSLYFVNGKVACMVDLMSFLVNRALPNSRVKVTSYSDTSVSVLASPDASKLKENPWVSITWDMERAKRMGLDQKDMWRKDPAEMLRSRCYAEAYRAIAGKELGGLQYSPEELTEAPAPKAMVVVGEKEAKSPADYKKKSSAPAKPEPMEDIIIPPELDKED